MAEPEFIERAKHPHGGYYRVYVWDTVQRAKVWCTAPDGSKRFVSRKQACEARDAYQRQLDEGYSGNGYAVARQDRAPSFAQVADAWAVRHPAIAKASQQAQRSQLRNLKAEFGNTRCDELDATQVRGYFARLLAEGRSSALRASRLEYLRKIITHAIKEGVRVGDPTEGIKIKVRRQKEPTYLTDQHVLELCCHLPRAFWPALLLSYDCGLRAGEIAGLRWFRLHLDDDNPYVVVNDVMDVDGTLREYPKGAGDELRVSLTPRVVTALVSLRKWRGEVGRLDNVFLNRHDRPLRHKSPNILLRAAFERSGLEAVTERPKWHHLRHSCATGLADSHAPATVIQAVLRHESLETSQRYIREASVGAQREWMARSHERATRRNDAA